MPKQSVLSPQKLDKRVKDAVKIFWKTKMSQGERQGSKTGTKDRGTRTQVTGGKHLDGFVDLFRDIALEAGVDRDCIYTRKNDVVLPGFFRASKQWDLLVVNDNKLIAVLELKSQFGSLGNNANNRAEEAVGNAYDFWTAYKNKQFEKSPKPWMGYLFMLEDSGDSTKRVGVREPHFPVLGAFKDASYMERYSLCCNQLVLDRLYDAAALVASDHTGGPKGQYREPDTTVGIRTIAASFSAHLTAFKTAGLFSK